MSANFLNISVANYMSDKIHTNKFVSLTYTITDEHDNQLECNDLPIQYIQGVNNQVIEKIELALEGHEAGDRVNVTLNPDEGFGHHQPELVFTDDINNVPQQFHSIGAEIEFQDDKGESKIFRVTQIDNDKLTVDGNHPYASKTITYHITINEVRDATPHEIQNGIATTNTLH